MNSESTQCWLHPSATLRGLLDDSTGTQVQARDLLTCSGTRALRIKKALQRSRLSKRGQVRCALCGSPVYLSGMANSRQFVFKHFVEDGSCPHETRSGLTAAQILAYRYNAQRESRQHIRLKGLVATCLELDPSFSEPQIERIWKGEGGDRRYPDVRSRYRDTIDIAFEVQLSTTFDSVMVEREEFYRQQGGLLVWVFGSFKDEQDRLMNRVVFANNNRNAFVVNGRTLAASREAGKLILECHWRQPSLGDQGLIWTACRRLVGFDELTLDQVGQRAFYVDTDRIETDLRWQLDGPPFDHRLEKIWLDLEGFEGRAEADPAQVNREWAALQRYAASKGANLPAFHSRSFQTLMRALYSAKLGKSVGWRFGELWGVAMHVFAQAPQFFGLLVWALDHYGHTAYLEEHGSNGTWAGKIRAWEGSIQAGEPFFEHDPQHDRIVALAFPELAEFVSDNAPDYFLMDPAPF